jgi:hypothetical protein
MRLKAGEIRGRQFKCGCVASNSPLERVRFLGGVPHLISATDTRLCTTHLRTIRLGKRIGFTRYCKVDFTAPLNCGKLDYAKRRVSVARKSSPATRQEPNLNLGRPSVMPSEAKHRSAGLLRTNVAANIRTCALRVFSKSRTAALDPTSGSQAEPPGFM